MPNTRTSDEVSASPLTGTELVRIVQAGGNAKATTAQLAGLYSPLTSVGDLIVHGPTGDARLPIAGNGLQLYADNTQTLGVKWYDGVGALSTTLLGGRLSFAMDFSVDAATYAATGVAIYGGTTDCASYINAALAANQRVQISGVALIKSQIVVPSGKFITMLPGAAIVLDTTVFTGARNSSTGVGIVFNGCTGGGISGGAIYPSSYVDDRALVAVRIVSSSKVRIDSVDMSNYSKANGIVSIDTCNDCFVTRCIFRDSTTNSATTGQVTGVTIDDNRIGSVSSQRLNITNNVFRDITVGASFLALYGYQSDGITVEVGTIGTVIADNAFYNMGEPIDCWGINGSITGNTTRHAYNFGIKLVHGAQGNIVSGNSIYDSGLAGITVQGSSADTADTKDNMIIGNVIVGVDLSGNWSASSSGCILLSDGSGTTFIPRGNVFSGNILNPGSGGKYCVVRSGSTDTTNEFPANHFAASGTVGYVLGNASTLGRVTATNCTRARIFVNASQTVTASTAAKVQLSSKTFDDRTEFDAATNFNWTCQIPGVYRFYGQVLLGTVVGTGKIGVLQIRKNGATTSTLNSLMTTSASYAIEDMFFCAAGDTVELWYTNGDASNVSINNGSVNSYFTVQQA
jgi:hypothetical protein